MMLLCEDTPKYNSGRKVSSFKVYVLGKMENITYRIILFSFFNCDIYMLVHSHNSARSLEEGNLCLLILHSQEER